MSVMYIHNYMNRFDRELFLRKYVSFITLLCSMREQTRYVCSGIKRINITCQVHTGYLFRGSPRMPRPSPNNIRWLSN